MKTPEEEFEEICLMQDELDNTLFDYLEIRNDIQEDICRFMNKFHKKSILKLGFVDAHYVVEEYEIIPNLILYFEEKKKRGNFDSEEDWLDYQSTNMEKCYDYFNIKHPHLDISCFPMEEEL